MAQKTKATSSKKPSSKPRQTNQQMTCFVIIGFGQKTDFATGRVLDLDATYEQLIRPAFDNVNVNCFRAIDANLTGSIDSIMYQWIYKADFVIADLSTLNANVFYELGVRHAQKPNTTIIIAESVLMTKIPFDLSSFVVHQYEHSGEKIDQQERDRFVPHMTKTLQSIIDVEGQRRKAAATKKRESDSPVYQFLKDMEPPIFDSTEYIPPPPYVAPEQRKDRQAGGGESLADIIARGEEAKKSKDFKQAIELFQQAVDLSPGKPDTFLAQRLALVTYKAGEEKDHEGNINVETAIQALQDAEGILKRYCAPKISTDPETLGLSGAINKRLHALSDDTGYLDRAIDFYERGFYVKQDYYNGINVAFMYTMKANLLTAEENTFDAIVNYGHANMIRKKVAQIVQEIIDDEEHFAKIPDDEKQWVYMTQAEAFQGMEMIQEEKRLAGLIKKVATEFGMDSYKSQKKNLAAAMQAFKDRINPNLLSTSPAAANIPAPSSQTQANAYAADSTDTSNQRVISINADLVKNKSIKSIEVHCKIDYADD